MSRSRRKKKIFGISCSGSEKREKTAHHRRLRRRVADALRESLRTGDEPETLPVDREVSDVWTWSKDGKIYWGGASEKDMRK